MKNLNRILFSLIASVVDPVGDGAFDVPKTEGIPLDSKTLKAVYAHAKRHDLGHLLAVAVRDLGGRAQDVRCGSELSSELERAELTAVWRVRNIENEQGRVRKCLEEAGIPFILLKGAVMRSYYPAAWMRTSSDIDVLVPRGDMPRAIAVIEEKLGYELSTTEPHDASLYAKSGVHLDMHTLFEGDRDDEALLNAAWRDSSDKGGVERFLTPEHFYFYHVAHMAEHVRNGGCGIRPFIDLYLLNAKLHYDRARVEALLTEYGLDKFEAMAVQLSESWMRGTESEALLPFEDYILTGGVYGTIEQTVAAKRRDGRGKLGYLMHRIFMPYSELKERHPRLDGRPWLTPFFEVWRWCGLAVPSRLKRSRKELRGASAVDSGKVMAVKELFDTLGL